MEDQKCRICGCTDEDCSNCIKITGTPCHWVEPDLCSACRDAINNQKNISDMNFFQQLVSAGNIDITMRIMQKGDKLTLNVMPGSPKSTNKPYNITGTGKELDEGFFSEVFPAVQEVKGLVSNKEEFISDAKSKAEKPKPADKKKKEKPKKAEKKSKEPEVTVPDMFGSEEEA